ncbi:MAG: hypothetical protein V5A76_07880 [Candidatus Thermoplasmatota archaeon]
MRFDRILSIFAIIMLIFSGLSVIIHSVNGEEIDIKQNEKGKERFEDGSEEDKISEKSESKKSEDDIRENREERGESRRTLDDTQNLGEKQNFDVERKIENKGKSNLNDNERSMVASQGGADENLETTSIYSNSDNELILDTYEIVFQENMTALKVDANFSIYQIELNSNIYTAEEIRNASNSDELIENISSNMTEVFVETISSVFSDAEKDFHKTTTTEGTSGPIKVSTSADIYLTKNSLGFDENNDQLNMSEMLKETMKMGANIRKGVNLIVKPGHNSTYRFEVPYPYRMESNDTWGVWGGDNHTWEDKDDRVSTWMFNNSAGDNEIVLQRELKIKDQNPKDIGAEEDISIDGYFELQELERINITLNNSISVVNIEKYDDFNAPDHIENLNYVNADFLRTAIENGLGEWKTITDEMNSSVDEIENKMPDFLGGLEFNYTDPGRDKGDIVRKYKVENFQPNITMDDEEIDIDNELTKSLINSGGIVDFKFPSLDEEYHHYSILLNFRVPDFMKLHNSSGEMSRVDGDYDYKVDFDPEKGFNGEFRSNLEVPDEQSINLDMDIDIESVSIETDVPNMDYTAIANAKVHAQLEVEAVKATQYMKDPLPEEITLEYATADLLRQLEKHDVFDKQRIVNMTREGEDIDDFEGMNTTVRDALGEEDIGISTRYQEGTWRSEDGELDAQPIVLLIDSEFNLPLKEAAGQSAFEIYSIDMGELNIPSIEGIDTNFKIIFPSGIIPRVEETDNVKTGVTSDSKSYIEVNTSGDAEDQISINPDIIITSGIFFSGDVYLHGIPLLIIMIIIISLIVLGIGIKVFPYKNRKRKKLIKKGMEDALIEENDPDRWLAYIPQEKIDKYQIDQDMLFELGLQEKLQEMRKEAGKDMSPSSPEVEETEEPLEKIDEDSDNIQEDNLAVEETTDEKMIDEEALDDESMDNEKETE